MIQLRWSWIWKSGRHKLQSVALLPFYCQHQSSDQYSAANGGTTATMQGNWDLLLWCNKGFQCAPAVAWTYILNAHMEYTCCSLCLRISSLTVCYSNIMTNSSAALTFLLDLLRHQELISFNSGGIVTANDSDRILELVGNFSWGEK